ncbi:AP2 domain transcription factor AP2X-7 [Toxoplasma gondii GT1]|uniref:AP2 domain transcription factor AP2X-7 n=2 Tax=Toxoplasma gondii TaxID=5811 RepID=S7UQH1_TOXGG|nr:AP2 domain transcription factor AP2X-7 [Toxoplasma gondii GT1]KAF4640050.1 AP2 domain transcription factor AP2X-7 [Toxoplasma gondii]
MEAMAEPTPPAPGGEILRDAVRMETPLPEKSVGADLSSESVANTEEERGTSLPDPAAQLQDADLSSGDLAADRSTEIALSTQLQLEQLDALQRHVQKQLLAGVSSLATESEKLQTGEVGAPFAGVSGDSGDSEEGREALASKTGEAPDAAEKGPAAAHFKAKGWGNDAGLAALSGGTTVEEEGENSSSSLGFSASSPGGQGSGEDTSALLPATSAVKQGTQDDLRLLVLQESMIKGTPGVALPTLEGAGGRVTPSASDQTFSSIQFAEEAQSPQKPTTLPALLTAGKRTRRGQAATGSDAAEGEAKALASPSALRFCGENPQSSLSTPQDVDAHGQSTEATPASSVHASGERKAKREEPEPMKTRRLARAAAQAAALAAASSGGQDGAASVKDGKTDLSVYLSQEGLASQVALAQSSSGPLANVAGAHPGLYLDEASALAGLVPGVGKGGVSVSTVPGAECPPMNASLLPVAAGLAGPGTPGAAGPLLASTHLAHPVSGLAGVAGPQGAGLGGVSGPQGGSPEFDRNDLLMRPGVSYYGGRQAWVAEIKYGGRRRFKVFSVAKYGYEGAKQMAVDTRERWEEAREAGELDQLMMSSQRHQCPVQSGVKGVYYDTARKGWRVVVTLNCRQMSKFFLASKFGNAEAKRLAIECRQMWLDAIQNGRADDVFEKARKLVSFKTKGVNGAGAGTDRSGAGAGAGLTPNTAVGTAPGVCAGATPHASAPGMLASRFANGAAGASPQGVGAAGDLSHSALLAGGAGAPLQGPSPADLLNSSLSSLGKFGAPQGTLAEGTSSSCLFSTAGTPSRNLRDASNELLLAAAAANASSAHTGTAALLSGLPGGAVGAGAGSNGGASGEGSASLAAAAAAFLSPSALTSGPRGERGDTPGTCGANPAGNSPTEENATAGQQTGAVLPAGTTPGTRPSPGFGLASFSGAGGAPGACAETGATGTGAAGDAGAALLAVASQQRFDPKLLQQHPLAEQQLVLQQWGEAAAAVAGGVGIPQTLFSSSGCAEGESNANGTMRDPVVAANQQQLQLQLLQELNRGASLPPLLDVLWGPSVAGTGAAAAAPGDRETGATQGAEGACGVGENGELVTLPAGATREETAGGTPSSLLTMGLGGQEEGAAGEGAAGQNGCGISAPVLSLLLQQQGLHHQQLAAAAAAAARGCAPPQGPGTGALCGFNRDGNMVVLGNPIAGTPGCLLSGSASGDGTTSAEKRGANPLGGALGNAMGAGMAGHLAGDTLLGAGASRLGNAATPTGASGSKRRRTQQGGVGLQGSNAGPGSGAGVGSRRHQRQGKDALVAGGLGGAGSTGTGDCAGAKPAGVTGSESSTCDVRGVYLDTRNNAWAATMGVHGRNVKKSFAVAKHGYETALQLAIHARRQLERIYWGSSPGDEQDASLLAAGRGNNAAAAGAAHAAPAATGALPASLAAPHQAAPAVPQTLLHTQQPLQSLQGLCWPAPGGIAQGATGAAGACARPEDEMTASMAALRGAILDPASLSRLSGEEAASAEAAARTAVAAGSLLYGAPFGSSLPAGLAATPVIATPSGAAEGATELLTPGGDPRGVVGAGRVRTAGEETHEGTARQAVPGMLGATGDSLLSPGLGMTAGASSGVLPGGPTLLGSGLEGREASLNMANLIATASAGNSPSGGLIVRDALAALLLQLDPQQRMALLQGDMNSLNSLQTAFLQNSQFFAPSCAPDANQLFVGANAPAGTGPLGAAAPERCAPSLVLGAEGTANVGCVGVPAGQAKETNGAASPEKEAEEHGAAEGKVERAFTFSGKEEELRASKQEETGKEEVSEAVNMSGLRTCNTVMAPDLAGVEVTTQQTVEGGEAVNGNSVEAREGAKEEPELEKPEENAAPSEEQ